MITGGTVLAVAAMPRPAEAALAAVLILATAAWVGGLVAIFVAARVAHRTLGVAQQVAFSVAWAALKGWSAGSLWGWRWQTERCWLPAALGRHADREHGTRSGPGRCHRWRDSAGPADDPTPEECAAASRQRADGRQSAAGSAHRGSPAGGDRCAQPRVPRARRRDRNMITRPPGPAVRPRPAPEPACHRTGAERKLQARARSFCDADRQVIRPVKHPRQLYHAWRDHAAAVRQPAVRRVRERDHAADNIGAGQPGDQSRRIACREGRFEPWRARRVAAGVRPARCGCGGYWRSSPRACNATVE